LRANAVDREAEPRQYLDAWKEVLAADPEHVSAARKIVSVARALGDYPELVEGQIALLEFTPDDAALRERLLAAAPRAGKEQRALECLARIGLEQLPADKIEGLRKRVAAACKRALSESSFELALTNFRTLVLAGDDHPSIEPLQIALVKKCVSSAREAEKEGDLAVAVPLAEQILEIVPDQPVALKIVARELLRQRRFSDLVEFCGPRVKPGPEYEAVQHLIERATEKLAT
jgi:tetratricopeptide (TPR) repeat protein